MTTSFTVQDEQTTRELTEAIGISRFLLSLRLFFRRSLRKQAAHAGALITGKSVSASAWEAAWRSKDLQHQQQIWLVRFLNKRRKDDLKYF